MDWRAQVPLDPGANHIDVEVEDIKGLISHTTVTIYR
jgi:hypothetical protein